MEHKLGIALRLAGVASLVLLASACAAHQPAGTAGAPGFWLGLWHGIIAPITFIISLFNDNVRMYAFPNAGRWYDFGYLLGIVFTWGSSGGAAAHSRRRR